MTHPRWFLPAALVFYVLLAIGGGIWNFERTGDYQPNLKWGSFELYLFLTIGFSLLVVSVSWLLYRFTRAAKQLDTEMKQLLGAHSASEILLLAAASAFGEELFFRGAMQDALAAYLQSPVLGWVIASLAFGLIHLPKDRLWMLWTIAALILGFILGGLYMWTHNLTHPMVAHFVINLLDLMRINRIRVEGDG